MQVLAGSHNHSTWSYDGSHSLEAMSEKFARRGCRVLLMTEHDRGFSQSRYEEFREACARASSANLLVVPGIEYSDADNRVHVLTWGLRRFLGENLPTLEMLRGVQQEGGIAVLAHPGRHKVWSIFSPDWRPYLLGIEMWNRKYDGWAPSRYAPALLEGTSLVPFVGLDFHTDRQLFPLTMALNLRGEVTEEVVVESMRSGECEPLAFGQPLYSKALRVSESVLRFAETGRRGAATAVRSVRKMVRK